MTDDAKVQTYSDALARLRMLNKQEQVLKVEKDKALYELRIARDALREVEYDLITK